MYKAMRDLWVEKQMIGSSLFGQIQDTAFYKVEVVKPVLACIRTAASAGHFSGEPVRILPALTVVALKRVASLVGWLISSLPSTRFYKGSLHDTVEGAGCMLALFHCIRLSHTLPHCM